MLDYTKELIQKKKDMESAVSELTKQIDLAVGTEMNAKLPKGMKVVSLKVEYDSRGLDRTDTFFAAVPESFDGDEIHAFVPSYRSGFFDSWTPPNMLVFNVDDSSPNWLKWQPWEEVFDGFYIDN